jgi:hypothetical protein
VAVLKRTSSEFLKALSHIPKSLQQEPNHRLNFSQNFGGRYLATDF